MAEGSYLTRSARIVFADAKWLQKSALLALIGFVPIFGAIFQTGYRMVLMRDVAWAVDRELPTFSESSSIVSAGANGFVVSLVWGLVLLPFYAVVLAVWFTRDVLPWIESGSSAGPPAAPWRSVVFVVPVLLVVVFSAVGLLRAAIYTRLSAGLSIAGVSRLIRAAPSGFWRASGLMVGVFALSMLLQLPAQFATQAVPMVGPGLVWVSAVLVAVVMSPLHLMSACAYGLWARETDPASWPPLRQAGTDAAGSVEQAHRADAVS